MENNCDTCNRCDKDGFCDLTLNDLTEEDYEFWYRKLNLRNEVTPAEICYNKGYKYWKGGIE